MGVGASRCVARFCHGQGLRRACTCSAQNGEPRGASAVRCLAPRQRGRAGAESGMASAQQQSESPAAEPAAVATREAPARDEARVQDGLRNGAGVTSGANISARGGQADGPGAEGSPASGAAAAAQLSIGSGCDVGTAGAAARSAPDDLSPLKPADATTPGVAEACKRLIELVVAPASVSSGRARVGNRLAHNGRSNLRIPLQACPPRPQEWNSTLCWLEAQQP